MPPSRHTSFTSRRHALLRCADRVPAAASKRAALDSAVDPKNVSTAEEGTSMRRLILAALAGMISSLPARAEMIEGLTKSRILSCAGNPSHEIRRGPVEYLYYRDRIDTEILPYGSARVAKREVCETVVVFVDDRPAAAEYPPSLVPPLAHLCPPTCTPTAAE